MEPEKIRVKVREKLKAGMLPWDPVLWTRLRPGERTPIAMEGGRVPGALCAACDEPEPEITHNYPDGPIRFHEACDRIWQEEREKSLRE